MREAAGSLSGRTSGLRRTAPVSGGQRDGQTRPAAGDDDCVRLRRNGCPGFRKPTSAPGANRPRQHSMPDGNGGLLHRIGCRWQSAAQQLPVPADAGWPVLATDARIAPSARL